MTSTTRRAILGAASLVLLTSLVGPAFAENPPLAEAVLPCTDAVDEAVTFSVTVDGEEATGRYALPATAPTGMVVFAHGYGHTSSSWVEHLKRTADDLGVIALAMDYRGIQVVSTDDEGIEKSRGWNVSAGAADSIAAAQAFQADCSLTGTIVMFGVSMGGNTSGIAVASGAKRTPGPDVCEEPVEGEEPVCITPEGDPLFDYWVDVEGVNNLSETYLAARALAPVNTTAANAVEDIEAEIGAPIELAPFVYYTWTNVTQGGEMAASGLKGAILVHAVDDGLVSHDQSRQMAAALQVNEIPYDFYTVVLQGDDTGSTGTTATGYAGTQVDPEYQSPLAGHASERSTTHPVMSTAFTALAELYASGGPTATEEFVVNG